MAPKRKLIGFDPESWQALELLPETAARICRSLPMRPSPICWPSTTGRAR